jgi:protein-tyrosine phosphatase
MVQRLQAAITQAGVTMHLVSGAEIALAEDLTSRKLNTLPSYNMAGKWYLVDTWESAIEPWLIDCVRHLQTEGGRVIFAHPERNDALCDDPPLIDKLAEAGCVFQLNYYTLADQHMTARRRTAERFLREGRYLVAASDLHQPNGLRDRFAGLRRLADLCRDEVKPDLFESLTQSMPRQILAESGVNLPV